MGLPNIGPLELIIILAIALLVVGPGRLPEMGNAIGRTIKEFRKASSDITDAVDADKDATSTKSSTEASDPAPNTLSSESKPNATTLQPAPATSSESSADGDDNA